MLVQLHVHHFALIEDVQLEFGNGLNVLSGETGVGKSILIDAVKLLLGDRAQSRDIRYGEEEARVEGAFDIPADPAFRALCEEAGVPTEGEDLVIFSRRVTAKGRNTCHINGTLLSLAQYRALAQDLITIFGQKDRRLLQDPEDQRELLDASLGADVEALKKDVAQAYQKAQASGRSYQKKVRDKKAGESRIAALQEKIDELGPLQLQIGEADQVRADHAQLAHWDHLQGALAQSQGALYGSDPSAYNLLVDAITALEDVASLHGDLPDLLSGLKEATQLIQDLNHELVRIKDRLPAQAGDLQALEDRLALFDRLERREGKTIDDLVKALAAAEEEILAFADMDMDIDQAQKTYIQDRQAYQALAEDLSQVRQADGRQLCQAIEEELADLGMAQTKLRFVFKEIAGRAHGIDDVQFEAQTNPGMPFLPVAEVASGGETSRLMLALQTVIGCKNPFITYIFDEIDTGIGGMVLEQLGDKLLALASKSQVICVTHAMPLAARADHLFVVAKESDGSTTWTTVETLRSEEAVYRELARMMGGQSDWHLAQARTLRQEKHPD